MSSSPIEKMFVPNTTPEKKYEIRREVVFMVFAGIFLGSLAMLNILGISRFIDLTFYIGDTKVPFVIAIGVLAYPITFLCTDFISEIYGKRRANMVVWIGLLLNIWVVFVLWLGGALPGTSKELLISMPESYYYDLPQLPTLENFQHSDWAFFRIRQLTFGAVTASMVAYLAAQFVDVHVFHYLKKVTKGRYLWVRNNFSTLTSQMVDTIAVILITHYYAHALPPPEEGTSLFYHLMVFILSGYIFKLVAALSDTLPFYFGMMFFKRFLNIPLAFERTMEKY